jgi:hypothetical protein
VRTFAWAGLEGTIYRVTVERFDWLLPIAGEADGIVWVPTAIEIEMVPSEANDSDSVDWEPILRA